VAIQNPCNFYGNLAMAQLYRMKALGIDPLDDSIILFYRGQSFHYLQQSLVDITNDAVVLTIVIWILIDVSSTNFQHNHLAHYL
jgi:hypothetical protein